MFYSTQILARRGPLGMVWMAAHMHEQLKRSQVSGMRLMVAVDALLHPETPLALRLSGQLLLGLVRLYSKQLGYLHQDCQDALVRLQLAFQAAAKPGTGGLHVLPGDAAANAMNDLLLDHDGSWGVMVDLMEAQLLHVPTADSGMMDDDDLLGGGYAARRHQQAMSYAALPGITPGGGGKRGAKAGKGGAGGGGGDDDVRPTRDQAARGRATPAHSRLVSQAESMFAAVVSSAAAHMSRHQSVSGGVCRGMAAPHSQHALAPRGDVLLLEEDEVFDAPPGDDGMLDLLGGVEVEVLREAPTSAARHAHHAAQLMNDLGGQVDSVTHRLLMGPQQAGAGGDTPSTAHASKAGVSGLRLRGAAGGDEEGMPGSHHSLQDSRAERHGLPGAGGRGSGSPSSGLMDMDLDLATLMGAGPGSQAGSVMPSPALQQRHTQHGEQASPEGVNGEAMLSDGHAGSGALDAADADGGQPVKRTSGRLQEHLRTAQAAGVPPVPGQGAAEPKVRSRAARRHPVVHRAAGSQGAEAYWRVGVLGRLKPDGPQPMDLPEPGARKAVDPTVLRAADCRALLTDTSALQVVRGLTAYRQNKRTRLALAEGPAQTLQQALMQPALQAGWGASLLAAVQQCQQLAHPAQPRPIPSDSGTSSGMPQSSGVPVPPAPAPHPARRINAQAPEPHLPHAASPPQPPDMPLDDPMMSPPQGPHLSHGGALPASGQRLVLQEVQPPSQPLAGPTTIQAGDCTQAQQLSPAHDQENAPDSAHKRPRQPLQPSMVSPPALLHPAPSPASQSLRLQPPAQLQDNAPPPPPAQLSPAAAAQAFPSPAPAHAPSPGSGLGLGSQLPARAPRPSLLPGGTSVGRDTPAPHLLATQLDDNGQTGGFSGSQAPMDGFYSGSGGSGSQAFIRSASGLTSSQRQGSQLEDRATRTLQDVTRLTASALPPELQSQVLSQGVALTWLQPSQPGQHASPQAPLAGLQGAGSQPHAAHHPSQPLLSQEVASSLALCEPLPLSQLMATQQTAGTQAPGARLQASRCFYDLLVLQTRGLVNLSQKPQGPSQAPATQALTPHPDAGGGDDGLGSQLRVQMTQRGVEVAFSSDLAS